MNFLINIFTNFAAVGSECDPPKTNPFFGFPHWYKYLKGTTELDGQCAVALTKLSEVWLIALAGVEILLRLAAIAAIIYIVYAGIRYISARGNPEKITTARISIQDALIGLVITIAGIAIVSFVGTRLG